MKRAIRSAGVLSFLSMLLVVLTLAGGVVPSSAIAQSGRLQAAATSALGLANSGSGLWVSLQQPGAIDACVLLTQGEIEAAVGNPVLAGEQYGAGACRWDTQELGHVTVLLIAHPTGSIREPFLCGDLRQGAGVGEPLPGVADVALWRFENVMSLFNSGELETCGSAGYVSLQLNGQRDEAALRQAALTLLGIVAGRL